MILKRHVYEVLERVNSIERRIVLIQEETGLDLKQVLERDVADAKEKLDYMLEVAE